MKILITADLHYRGQWFRLLSRAAEWDLVCIAGDLLDMFNAEPRIVQARTISRWIRELAKVTRVAICSGNHDNAGRQISADRAPVYEWLYELGKEPRFQLWRLVRSHWSNFIGETCIEDKSNFAARNPFG
jgi:DNA repair exonuclease SbcCD nuclease subunit